MKPEFFSISLLAALSCLLFSPHTEARVYKLQVRSSDNQEVILFQGQERLVQEGGIEFYASCLPSTDTNGVATIEIGTFNTKGEPVRFGPSFFQARDSKGNILKILTRDEAHGAIDNEKASLDSDISVVADMARQKVLYEPTLDELVGSPRAQSLGDLREERDTGIADPYAAPERRQKQADVEHRVREMRKTIRIAADQKDGMIDLFYLKEVNIYPVSAYNGILMVEIKTKAPWIEIETTIGGEEFKVIFEILD